MNRATFPTLLNSKATLLGSFTRSDLVILGGAYLILSWMKVSGIYSLLINASILWLVKHIQRKLPNGFLRCLNSPRILNWKYKMGELDE